MDQIKGKEGKKNSRNFYQGRNRHRSSDDIEDKDIFKRMKARLGN